MDKRPILTVVMDGIGINQSHFGNAVYHAKTPYLDSLITRSLYTTLNAHGTFVGLGSDKDMGNSEVGHNALGSGQVCDQGAKLVEQAITSKSVFKSGAWGEALRTAKEHTLHFLGLLSDGNVHSHENHLYEMLREAKRQGQRRVRVHVLFDGRDVAQKSAETYVQRLEGVIAELSSDSFDIAVASGGGRMTTTMDRYGADWSMVERGYYAHVHGQSKNRFKSLEDAVAEFRKDEAMTDQYFPEFVIIGKDFEPVGRIKSGDAVIFYNFRGDRALEISQAFESEDFSEFDRKNHPKVFFAGMMEYDGDLHIPSNFLVNPPEIHRTLGEVLVENKIRQFACSETQKFGHVTYFWNGNRSGMIDPSLEEYLEIPSDLVPFNEKPSMKATEITDETVKRILSNSFDFGRINYANGDMVGHTGDFYAAVSAVETVDTCIGRLIEACNQMGVRLIITADHGNADEMFDASEKDFPTDWYETKLSPLPKPKTSHTLNQVPFYLYDPKGFSSVSLGSVSGAGIASLAPTVLDLFDLKKEASYKPSLLVRGK